jgi:hypothetical protein
VERGELTLYLEDDCGEVRRITATAGDVVHIPSGRKHTIRNESEAEALGYVTFAPGAAMEGFLRAAGALGAAGRLRPEQVMALAERHGIELTGPVPGD